MKCVFELKRWEEMQTSGFHNSLAEDVVALWRRCGLTRLWSDTDTDILRKQKNKNYKFFVGHDAKTPIGTIIIGFDSVGYHE